MTPTGIRRLAKPFLRTLSFSAFNMYLLLNGCIPITEGLTEGPVVKQERSIHEQGTVQANIRTHPDHEGWTVSLSQPILREIKEVRQVTSVRRYYYFQPLALPAGLFACPSSAWGWAWNILTPSASAENRRNLLNFTVEACLLALMIVRSDLKRTDESTVISKRMEPNIITVREGHLIVRWNGPKHVELSYPVDAEGRAVIRLSHLTTAIQHAGYEMHDIPAAQVGLSIWHKNQLQSKQPIEITPTALQTAGRHYLPVIAGTERWPRPLVMKVRFQNGTPTDLGLEERLHRIAMKHRMPVITSEEVQSLLRLELEHIMRGLTEDQTAVSPGHWLAPTVLINVRTDETATHTLISLKCHNIHTGELLAHIEMPAGPGGLELAIDVALAKLDDVLGHLITLQ